MTRQVMLSLVAVTAIASSTAMAERSTPWMPSEKSKIEKMGDYDKKQASMEKILSSPFNTVIRTGNNIYVYGKGAFKLVGKAGHKTVRAVSRSGRCVNRSAHPGDFVACGVKLAGDATVVVYKLGVYEGANAVYFVGAVGRDVADELTGAFRACRIGLEKSMGRPIGTLVGTPCQVVALGFDASGRIIWASGVAVGNTLGNLAQNGGDVINNVIDIPAELLRLNPKGSIMSTFKTIESTLCLGVDIVAVIPRFAEGLFRGNDIGNVCQ